MGQFTYSVYMYVAVVPNRNSPPAILLRESFRENGKVHNRTIANLSHWPPAKVDALRAVLKGATALGAPLPQAFDIVRSRPHGHVAAVLGTLRKLHLDRLFDKHADRNRDLVLAMIAARVLEPASKLATSRALHPDTLSSTLGELLHLDSVTEDELYQAMDWLLPQQARIEDDLAKRHLAEGSLVLYDLTSTYFEGRHCPLGKLGHSRDDQKGKLQVVFGLLTNAEGCPVAVEVYAGNTSDPKTVSDQVTKLRQRFGLQRVILVGDRGMITSARLRENLKPASGIEWILASRAISMASSNVAASGLSINSGLCAAITCRACSRCTRPSTLSTSTASTFESNAGISGTISTPHLLLICAANPSTRLALLATSGLPPLKAATTRAPGI